MQNSLSENDSWSGMLSFATTPDFEPDWRPEWTPIGLKTRTDRDKPELGQHNKSGSPGQSSKVAIEIS